MQRPEISLRKPWLKAWPGMLSLVEPSLGSTPGVPDTWLAFHQEGLDVEGWLEFKVREPDGSFQIRAKQRLWHGDYLRAGGLCAGFCVVDEQSWCLVPSRLGLEHGTTLGHPSYPWEALPELSLPSFVERCFEGNGGQIGEAQA